MGIYEMGSQDSIPRGLRSPVETFLGRVKEKHGLDVIFEVLRGMTLHIWGAVTSTCDSVESATSKSPSIEKMSLER